MEIWRIHGIGNRKIKHMHIHRTEVFNSCSASCSKPALCRKRLPAARCCCAQWSALGGGLWAMAPLQTLVRRSFRHRTPGDPRLMRSRAWGPALDAFARLGATAASFGGSFPFHQMSRRSHLPAPLESVCGLLDGATANGACWTGKFDPSEPIFPREALAVSSSLVSPAPAGRRRSRLPRDLLQGSRFRVSSGVSSSPTTAELLDLRTRRYLLRLRIRGLQHPDEAYD
ncbi:hypothetical protein SETIT_6G051600v2 [Setaria italica]|uniref:Uncharacterized protein n=1 Tax=Setaria italica TaxID=4555 RepID=A0A368RIE3_SETIT|nr:hypothetical protein SETIT_6G051600v2 [Setaria italica]